MLKELSKSSLFASSSPSPSGDGLHALAPGHDELVLERLAEEALVHHRGARPQPVRVVLARARARPTAALKFRTARQFQSKYGLPYDSFLA